MLAVTNNYEATFRQKEADSRCQHRTMSNWIPCAVGSCICMRRPEDMDNASSTGTSSAIIMPRKLNVLDGTFNTLCRVFEKNSSWQSCLQILEDASLAGPGVFRVKLFSMGSGLGRFRRCRGRSTTESAFSSDFGRVRSPQSNARP